jgi:hypothetical protein
MVVTVNVSAQERINDLPEYDYSSAYVPATVLVGTFFAVNMAHSQHQRDVTAFAGMATAVISFAITEQIKKKRHESIRNYLLGHRNTTKCREAVIRRNYASR